MWFAAPRKQSNRPSCLHISQRLFLRTINSRMIHVCLKYGRLVPGALSIQAYISSLLGLKLAPVGISIDVPHRIPDVSALGDCPDQCIEHVPILISEGRFAASYDVAVAVGCRCFGLAEFPPVLSSRSATMQYGYKVNVLTETSTTHIDSSLTRERTTQHGVPADICGSNHEFQRETEGDSVKNQVKIPRVSCCRRRATINTWGTDFANAGAQEA
ncbi:predicted protein [Histoplasma capsulatum H143]|uniref:Uncharacterized protein n=1 Tax=Ajellomyces capsulatus (strain H143) TaxID=544712 RepID=C6HEA8_AJECH|nr:predicted protein [Histoplasma capsulatum H143]